MAFVQQQVHAYRGGHSLVGASTRLSRQGQDLVDRLSDLAGPIGPGDVFSSYLTLYPLVEEALFVVAMTWQDLSAPRAGCVITRSFLVPLDDWKQGAVLWPLVQTLSEYGPDVSRFEAFEVSRSEADIPPVDTPVANELVEALFLERRQPLAVFDAANAQDIVVRLFEGVWSAFRASLSVCTHAYSPRTLRGRSFDLVFAPGSARSNFSSWSGRKIDAGADSRAARHHWTQRIAHGIFSGTRVEALAASFADVPLSADVADESQFRLALLWAELEEKSKTSPLAVLGLLDILASLQPDQQALSESLRPILRDSIRLASTTLSPSDLWDYLSTLLGKFPKRIPPTGALRDIRSAATFSSANDASAAIEFIRRSTGEAQALPAILASGIGDGLASLEQAQRFPFSELSTVSGQTLLGLLAHSKEFADALFSAIHRGDDAHVVATIAKAVEGPDVGTLERVRRNVLPDLRFGYERGLLSALLSAVNEQDLLTAVKLLFDGPVTVNVELALGLVEAASRLGSLSALRDSLSHMAGREDVDITLLRTLTPDIDGFLFVLDSDMPWPRQRHLLLGLVEAASDADLRSLPSNVVDRAVMLIAGDDWAEVSTLLRLLRTSISSLSVLLNSVTALASRLSASDRSSLAGQVVYRIFFERVSLQDAAPLVEAFAGEIPSKDFVNILASPSQDADRVADNLAFVLNSSQSLQDHVLRKIDQLSENIAHRRTVVMGIDGIQSWAKLISLAGAKFADAQLKAASIALDFALGLPNFQVSELILASFPKVYGKLRTADETPPFFSFFLFADWDRCKTARRDLAQKFVNSRWPRRDLLRVADSVGETGDVVSFLARTPQGKEFLKEALSDGMLPPYIRHEVMQALG